MIIFQNNSLDWWTGNLPDLGADVLTPQSDEPLSQPETQPSGIATTTTANQHQSAVCQPGGAQGEKAQGGLMDPIPPVPPHLLPIIADLETTQNRMTGIVAAAVMDPIHPIPPHPIADLEAVKNPMAGAAPGSLSDPIAPVLPQAL